MSSLRGAVCRAWSIKSVASRSMGRVGAWASWAASPAMARSGSPPGVSTNLAGGIVRVGVDTEQQPGRQGMDLGVHRPDGAVSAGMPGCGQYGLAACEVEMGIQAAGEAARVQVDQSAVGLCEGLLRRAPPAAWGLRRRWVVERTLSRLMRSRRPVRDCETLPGRHEGHGAVADDRVHEPPPGRMPTGRLQPAGVPSGGNTPGRICSAHPSTRRLGRRPQPPRPWQGPPPVPGPQPVAGTVCPPGPHPTPTRT